MKHRTLLFAALVCLTIAAAGDEFASRADLALSAALKDVGRLDGTSPMHYWVAQQLFERGEKAGALKIVSSGVRFMRQAIEKREAAKSTNIGANGFLYWGALNCYVKWHSQFPPELLEDYRYVFTHAKNYKGTTSNKQNVGGINFHSFTVGMFATSCGCDSALGAFYQLEQGLLHPFARYISGDTLTF
jgi:hypothetical protein